MNPFGSFWRRSISVGSEHLNLLYIYIVDSSKEDKQLEKKKESELMARVGEKFVKMAGVATGNSNSRLRLARDRDLTVGSRRCCDIMRLQTVKLFELYKSGCFEFKTLWNLMVKGFIYLSNF